MTSGIAQLLFALSICLLISSTGHAQYFTLPGWHAYALNSRRQVFDLSPDGKIGISLRNDPVATHPARLTTFDPILGTQLDTKTFGFGPLEVCLAQVGNNLRAVVLTSEGGPRRIYLFDVSPTGLLTQLTSTQLTTSNTDGGSNVVLSGAGAVGFVSVASTNGADVTAFSLNDGAILSSLPGSTAATLVMKETATSRVIAFRQGNVVKIVNAMNPSQLSVIGSVTLVSNGEFSGSGEGLAFSDDGRYLFVANQFYDFAAIDLNSFQIVGTIAGANYRFVRVRVVEKGAQRLLAVLSSQSGTGGTTALLLVDATNPAQLTVVNQYIPLAGESFFYKADFAFSHDGLRLYAAAREKLIAFDLPTFNKAWEQPVPNSMQVHQLRVYGPNDEVLGAWDTQAPIATFGAFPAFPPNVSIDESITATEGDGATATFTISLSSSAAPHRVAINYATAAGSATLGSDYTGTNGTATIQPGNLSTTISMPILNDSLDEFDETFLMRILSAAPGIITRAQGTATIVDDDPPPLMSINDISGGEANTTGAFSVSLSAASGKSITVNYSTAADTATPGADYVSSSGVLTFAAGETLKFANVSILNDIINEDNERFFMNLTNASNVTINDGQGIGTIFDNDAPILATDQSPPRAMALDAVTFVREPFASINPYYFGDDKRTRVMLFTPNVALTQGLVITAQALDSQQMTLQLPVEYVGILPGANPVVQIVVRLPDGITSAGDLQVSVTARSRTSAKVLVGVKP
jgi:hypothetical protein